MRVAVTGRGVVTGLGLDLATTWDRLLAGESAARPIGGSDASDSELNYAGQVDDEALAGWLPRGRARRFMDRRGLLAFAAAHQALQEAGLDSSEIALGDRAGVTLATGHVLADVGELAAAITQMERANSCEWTPAEIVAVGRRVPPLSFITRIINMPANHVAIAARCRGPSATFTDDCGGAHALGSASRWIRSGMADMMLVGGVDSRIDPLHLGSPPLPRRRQRGFLVKGPRSWSSRRCLTRSRGALASWQSWSATAALTRRTRAQTGSRGHSTARPLWRWEARHRAR